jgi:hypothetical protein
MPSYPNCLALLTPIKEIGLYIPFLTIVVIGLRKPYTNTEGCTGLKLYDVIEELEYII